VRRLVAVVALLAVAAVVVVIAAGGGGRATRPAGPVREGLPAYFPRDAALVAVVDGGLDDAHRHAATALLTRLGLWPPPGSAPPRKHAQRRRAHRRHRGARRRAAKAPSLAALIGDSSLAVGVERRTGLGRAATRRAAVLVVRPADARSATRFVRRPPRGLSAELDRGVLVVARSRADVAAAIAARRSPRRLRAADFTRRFAGLPAGGPGLRLAADPRALIAATPSLRGALNVKWVGALRRAALTMRVAPYGFSVSMRVATDPRALSDADLPLAPGAGAAPPVIGRRGEGAIGIRDPARALAFAMTVFRAAAPRRAAELALIARALRARGVDLRADVIGRLGAVASIAFNRRTHDWALRIALLDAAGVRAALVRLAGSLPDLAAAVGIRGVGLATPDVGASFYALARPTARVIVFGVVGTSFVAATQPKRAAQLVSEPSRTIVGARGSLVASIPIDGDRLTGSLTVAANGITGRGRLTLR
jgi:hypothetical protein